MTCKKLRCKLFGHKWLTMNTGEIEEACFRISYQRMTQNTPYMVQLYCQRSGEWHEISNGQFKNYLAKYPFNEEEDEPKQEEVGVVIVEKVYD